MAGAAPHAEDSDRAISIRAARRFRRLFARRSCGARATLTTGAASHASTATATASPRRASALLYHVARQAHAKISL
eukprot:6214635-Pleurochrysis_carterae.AAC.1